jgi:hypothetical protein
MKGYWLILGTEISNDSAQSEYVSLWKPLAEKYQAQINPLRVPPLLREARDAHRLTIVGFPHMSWHKLAMTILPTGKLGGSPFKPQSENF